MRGNEGNEGTGVTLSLSPAAASEFFGLVDMALWLPVEKCGFTIGDLSGYVIINYKQTRHKLFLDFRATTIGCSEARLDRVGGRPTCSFQFWRERTAGVMKDHVRQSLELLSEVTVCDSK